VWTDNDLEGTILIPAGTAVFLPAGADYASFGNRQNSAQYLDSLDDLYAVDQASEYRP
jgi:hypothetical protein